VRDVELRAEYVDHLVVLLGDDRLGQRDEVGMKLAQSIDEHRAARGPVSAPTPEVLRHDAGTGRHLGSVTGGGAR
jgi:hypothetical protein